MSLISLSKVYINNCDKTPFNMRGGFEVSSLLFSPLNTLKIDTTIEIPQCYNSIITLLVSIIDIKKVEVNYTKEEFLWGCTINKVVPYKKRNKVHRSILFE